MGRIHTFYSPQRGTGLTTLLVKIGEWLAVHSELTVCLLDFTDRSENACALTGNQISLPSFLENKQLNLKPDRPAAICDLKPDSQESFAALRKAQEVFDLVFVDLSNRLDNIADQVFELSNQVILLAPGTETVIHYFQNVMEMSRLLGKSKAKEVNLLLNHIRHRDEIAILNDDIKNNMIGFVMDQLSEDGIQRVAENFYYGYYLEKLADRRGERLKGVIDSFAQKLDQAENDEQLGRQLWKAIEELELPYNKGILLIRWLIFRATLGQQISQAAADLIPRFIGEDFNGLAQDFHIETGTLGELKMLSRQVRPA